MCFRAPRQQRAAGREGYGLWRFLMTTTTASKSLLKAGADDAKRYWLAEGRAPGGFIRQVDYPANARGVDPLFEGIKIVDCDTHFTEPPDLWVANAPIGMRSKMPHVERIDGVDKWVCM